MAFARISGTLLHYEFLTESKKAPVVVLINPLGTDFRIWLPLLDELTEDWSILLYDKRGHGLSDLGGTPCSISAHADDLLGLLDHLRIPKAHLVGLSVGGLIALEVALRRPQAVRKLILANTAHKIGPPEIWDERVAQVRKEGLASILDNLMQRWFTPHFHRTRPDDIGGYRNMVARQPAEGYCATCAAIRDADFTSDLSKIKIPVLCLAGDQDGSMPADVVRTTASLIDGAGFEVLSKCGHIPPVEQPEMLAEIMAEFFSDD